MNTKQENQKNQNQNKEQEAQVLKALELARATRLKAYAPYSHFLVGAAMKLKGSEEIICGNNVENASYSLTICAERSALFTAVARSGASPKLEVEFMVVVADLDPFIVPCGACLQVMREFLLPTTPLYLAHPNEKGFRKKLSFEELLPFGFSLS